MDMNTIRSRLEEDGACPNIARCVRILLVDYDTTSLMSLASQFEEQHYKVTTAESGTIALSLIQAQKEKYDIVVADLHMPEINIYEFVQRVHRQLAPIPIILIAEDVTMDLVREAVGKGVCYILSKPPRNRDIINIWQNICRVTGKIPAATD